MDEKELAALKEANPKAYEHIMSIKAASDKLAKEKEEWEKSKGNKGDPDPDPEKDKTLADKARQEREAAEQKSKYERELGSALKFNMGSAEFLKSNAGLLPKTAEGIFAAAEKGKYESEVDKANEIKVGLVSEFFAIQANMDQLTASQKVELEDFLKLTKNKQQERVATVYAMIFEPTLESIRKIEKAKQVGSGAKDQSSAEKQLADTMMKRSKAHYLGDKQ